MTTSKSNFYYSIRDDIEKYPDAWNYNIYSGRGTGKTYGTLSWCLDEQLKFIFLKRTKEDVELLMSGNGKFSPFKSINRDRGTNIKPISLYKGYVGGFWDHDGQDKPGGEMLGYLIDLNAVSKVKGFDLWECPVMIFDEFIPQPWERINTKEGTALLDLYMTISRDREQRGFPALKLICLANPTSINNPWFNAIRVTDAAVEMEVSGDEYWYDRGILLHKLKMSEEFNKSQQNMKILQAMKGTEWADMTTGAGFIYDDMSNVGKRSLKGFRCMIELIYRRDHWYIYQNDAGDWYCCRSRATPALGMFDLSKDNDQRKFYAEYQIDLRQECTDGRMMFQSYEMYNIIVNFRRYFKI